MCSRLNLRKCDIERYPQISKCGKNYEKVPEENYFKSGEKSFKIFCQPDMFSVILIYELNKKVLTKKEKKTRLHF